MRITRVFFGIAMFFGLYTTEFITVSTHHFILKTEMTSFCYILPIIIVITIIGLVFIAYLISEKLYCKAYTIMGLIFGYILYAFQISLVVRLINLFIPLPIFLNLLILYITPLLICCYGVYNANYTRVENIVLKYPGFKEKVKILLLSDIHLGAIHQEKSIKRIVAETQQLNPDIVVITGDMADGSLKVKSEWLKPFDILTIPVLFVTGNHEELNPKLDMIEAIKTTKIKHIGIHGVFKYKGVNFIGEDFGYDLRKCLLNVKKEEGVPNVLLSHIPILKPAELEKYNIFLFLAGHTHGGQLFPLHVIVYFANACFSGLYSDKNKKHHIYVTDGVNNALVPMRVGSKRIFPLITIEGEKNF